MKTIQIFAVILFLLVSVVCMPTVMAIGGGPTGHMDNPSPWCGEVDVPITDKGVQTCINVTVDQDCVVNLTFQWFNTTQYAIAWLDWWMDWPYGGSTPSFYDDIYWSTYGEETNVSASGQHCFYNENVTCSTDGSWTEWQDWRVIANFTCSQNYTYNETFYCYYMPEPCPLFYIYPPWNSTNVCPCCDAYCVGINNVDGHNMNISVYHSHSGDEGTYHLLTDAFQNVTNGTYCFCMGENKFSPAYIYDHTNYSNATNPINTWWTVPFNESHHMTKNIQHSTTVNNDTFTILRTGEYTLRYQMMFIDTAANPNSDAFGRIMENGNELHGSLRCVHMSKKDAQVSVAATVMVHLDRGDQITFEYVGTATTVNLESHCTLGEFPYSCAVRINRIDDVGQHPMLYNWTYYWYVNVTDVVTGEYMVSDTYQFTTAQNISDCPCGEEAIRLATGRGEIIRFGSLNDLSALAFILAIIALLAIIIIYHGKGGNGDEETEEDDELGR